METAAHLGHTQNRRQLASRRLSVVLEMDFTSQAKRRPKADKQGDSGIDFTALPETLGHCGRCTVPWSGIWRKMLSSRSWKGKVWWKHFQQIKERFPLLRPKLHLPYGALQALATL